MRPYRLRRFFDASMLTDKVFLELFHKNEELRYSSYLKIPSDDYSNIFCKTQKIRDNFR